MKLQELSLSDLYGLKHSLEMSMLGKSVDILKLKNNGFKSKSEVLRLSNEKLKGIIKDVENEINRREDEIINEIVEEPKKAVCENCKFFREAHFPVIALIENMIADGICENKNEDVQPVVLDSKKDRCNYFMGKSNV
jgi:hypothetical protein